MTKYLKKSAEGLTLVEVLITTALMSMGLLAVANMQIVSMQVNTTSSKLAQATMATQEIMERLISLPFNHPDLADTTEIGITTSYEHTSPPPGYNITWEVDAHDADRKNVNIVATWGPAEDPKKLILPMQISTISNPGVYVEEDE